MKKLFTTFLAVCGMYIATAQAPEIEWQVTLGGSDWDVARVVKQTNDGGYIVAGSSSSTDGDVTGNHGDSDFWIVKLSNSGNIQWQKSLGGSKEDKANSIQQTTDGGYIIAGSTKSNDGNVTGWHEGYYDDNQNSPKPDYWIVKLNSAGVIQWQKPFGGSERDEAHAIKQTNDGGYIVIGLTTSTDGDVVGNNSGSSSKQWVIKLDSSGNIQWQKLLEDSNYIKSDIQQTSDNGYVIALNKKIIKLNNSGNTQWEISSGFENSYFGLNSIQQTTDGGYIAVGDVNDNKFSVLKFDNLGNTEWSMTVEEGGEFELTAATSVQQTTDGGYIVTGGIYQDAGMDSYNIWTVKLNNLGEIQWKKTIGDPTDEWQVNSSYSVQQTIDGGYILGGSISPQFGNNSAYDCLIIKLANYTQIPDTAFEQRLIDLGLDDVLDGHVLTSNIIDVSQLDVSNRNISDLTGIEDFSSLISLNCSGNQLTSLVFSDGTGGKNANATNDFGLEYLNASGNQLTELDVSGLSSLTTLLVNNNALTKLNVKNGNNVNFVVFNAANNPALLCIQVDDVAWSTINWTNIDAHTSFNEDCAYMSVTDSQLSQLEIYPNPAKNVVHFSKPIDGQLYNAAGQKVMTIKNAKSINVVGLAKGVYVLKTSEGITKKIVVK